MQECSVILQVLEIYATKEDTPLKLCKTEKFLFKSQLQPK